jgi:uncharacterized protein (TIGR02246 family)
MRRERVTCCVGSGSSLSSFDEKIANEALKGETRMAAEEAQSPASNDESEIRALIERWSQAVRDQNMDGIRTDHDPDILLFDVPLPLLSRGLEAYMASWEAFLSSSEKPVVFDFQDIEISAGPDVAFATAVGRCVNIDSSGNREPLAFRLTMGLRKVDARWRVMHEHHSLPAL